MRELAASFKLVPPHAVNLGLRPTKQAPLGADSNPATFGL